MPKHSCYNCSMNYRMIAIRRFISEMREKMFMGLMKGQLMLQTVTKDFDALCDELCKDGKDTINDAIKRLEGAVQSNPDWYQFYAHNFVECFSFTNLSLSKEEVLRMICEERDFVSFFQEVQVILKEYAAKPYSEWEKLSRIAQFISDFFEAFGFLYKAFDELILNQMNDWAGKVAEHMPMLYRDGEYDRFNLLVSLGDCDWFKHKDVMVNASLISEKHLDTFLPKNRFVGWCFKPSGSQILGMSSGEPGSTAIQFSTTPEVFAEVLRGKEFLSETKIVQAFLTLARKCEEPEEFLRRQGVNTVLLAGDVEPCGVFCRIPGDWHEIKPFYEKAKDAAKLFRLPLVTLYENKRLVTVERL